MSSILATVGDTFTTLAQIDNPIPEPPPLADKILQFVRYFTWFALMSGIISIIYAGGRFAWEKWSGGSQSPKMVAGAMIGGVVATSAGTIMNAVLSI
ncbi:hypothetical protein ACL02S_10400 [Nocardia sp. 004]|uniref:hypothetical protein n=1 Tax=Nocardia sp. 004 TaxID=3385978 RepID=UPI0039A3A076